MKRVVIACAVALASMPWPATGQDVYRQTVVVTAAATPVEIGSATRTLTVISREQIEALPVYSIADVLRLAAPIDVRSRGQRGVQTDFAVRGASFGQMLVLVDGVRLNDSQTGHHNGDIPVPLEMVERIEVMYGSGSSLFGADAFGGTINVITRRSVAASSVTVAGGSFGLVSADGVTGFSRGALSQTIGGSIERSGGFIPDRDFRTADIRSRTAVGEQSSLSVSYMSKEFGARNFYGAAATGDAMSREWTDQTLVAADHVFGAAAGWKFSGKASYRTHGDRFLFDETAPASASIHRSHEAIGSVLASRRTGSGATVTMGAETGGDWIRSNNLGNHALGRISGFEEWRQTIGARVQIDGSLRVDRYDEFGSSWSPSAGLGWWVRPNLRLRTSAGRAFRVPTFTERYYSDRNHLARPEIGPERSWSGEGGADLFLASGWLLQATVFGRADRDVIDWLCADRTCGTAGATERWHTFNVRDVATKGVELGVRRTFTDGAFVLAQYTGFAVDAPDVEQMSKYLLDVAPRSFTAAGSVPLPAAFRVAPRVEYRRRSRAAGSSDYVIVDARVARRFGSQLELAVDATNILDAEYEEVPGVRMPGAAMSVSLAVHGR
jgi:iron complex outermembrane receptor protein